jgi:hypothetical protein
MERDTVFLGHAKPFGTIRGVGRFKDTCIYFLLNKFANVVVDSGGYRNIALNPGSMGDYRHLDRGKEILSKMTTFGVVPSKTVFMQHHKMM